MDPTRYEIPVIDMAETRPHVSELIVKACESLGFFMVVNHGVAENVISQMEATGSEFFSLPGSDKQRAGPPNPLGYGSRSIGSNGDTGDVEYLLLHARSTYISLRAKTICKKDPAILFVPMASLLLFLKALVEKERDQDAAPSDDQSIYQRSVNKKNSHRVMAFNESYYYEEKLETWRVGECFIWP